MIDDPANVVRRKTGFYDGSDVAIAQLLPEPGFHREAPKRLQPGIGEWQRGVPEKDRLDARTPTLGVQASWAVPRGHLYDFPVGGGQFTFRCVDRAKVSRRKPWGSR